MYVDSVIRSSYNIPCRPVIIANLRGGEGFLCEFSNLDVYIARLHAAVLTAPPLPSPRRRNLVLACAPHCPSPACAPPFTGLCAARSLADAALAAAAPIGLVRRRSREVSHSSTVYIICL